MIANWSFLTPHTHTHSYTDTHCSWAAATLCAGQLPHLSRQKNRENRNSPTHHQFAHGEIFPPSLPLSLALSLFLSPGFFWSDCDRETSGRSSSFLCLCFFGEIRPSDNLSPSSLKELNKHRPLPVVPLNFLSRRQETLAGATGSKPPAAQCVPRVRVRSGVGPITFFPGSP